jgi:hypothetical protein
MRLERGAGGNLGTTERRIKGLEFTLGLPAANRRLSLSDFPRSAPLFPCGFFLLPLFCSSAIKMLDL